MINCPTRKLRPSVFPLVVLCVAGCASRGNIDVLESRLRLQEDRLLAAQNELSRTRSDLNAAQQESQALRAQLDGRGESAILPEQAQTLYRATSISFNALLTGGLDQDEQPGDELLTAVLTPQDEDGQLIKVPGSVQLELIDLSRPEDRQRIGFWKFATEQSRDFWHNGFLYSGYRFRLPWQNQPTSPELLLHARMTLADGRQFDTSQKIKVNLLPGALAKTAEPEVEQAAWAQSADEPSVAFEKSTSTSSDTAAAPLGQSPFEVVAEDDGTAPPQSGGKDSTPPEFFRETDLPLSPVPQPDANAAAPFPE